MYLSSKQLSGGGLIMAVKITQPARNLREELNELRTPTGIAGEAMLRADTPQEQFNLIGAGRKNLIINGDMRIAQRGTSFANIGSGVQTDTVDRMGITVAGGIVTQSQVSCNHPEFDTALRTEVTTSTADNTICILAPRPLEINSVVNTGVRTGEIKDLNISFWARSNVSGVYTFELQVPTDSGSYEISKEYELKGTGTWEYISIWLPAGSIPPITAAGNTAGFGFYFWLDSNSTYKGLADSGKVWSLKTSAGRVSDNQVKFMATVGNYIEVTGLQLELGKVATPFEHRSYGEELALCQRYYQSFSQAELSWTFIGPNPDGAAANGYSLRRHFPLRTTMRGAPAATVSSLAHNLTGAPNIITSQDMLIVSTHSGGYSTGANTYVYLACALDAEL